MVGNEEFVRRSFLESLGAVPGHVLDHQARAVGDENHIQQTVPDDRAVQALDDVGKHGKTGWRARIAAVAGKDVADGAFGPVGWRGVDSFLDVRPVEINFCSIRQVWDRSGEAQDVPEDGTGGGDLVDVEAGVYFKNSIEDGAPKVAARDGGGWVGERTFGRIDEVII